MLHKITYKGLIMAFKRVTISIDDTLNDRWTKVAKRLDMTKSGMVVDFLEQVIPILEKEKPKDMIGSALKEVAKSLDQAGSLFDE